MRFAFMIGSLCCVAAAGNEICCEAEIASCLACKADLSVEQFCLLNPKTTDCQCADLIDANGLPQSNCGNTCTSYDGTELICQPDGHCKQKQKKQEKVCKKAKRHDEKKCKNAQKALDKCNNKAKEGEACKKEERKVAKFCPPPVVACCTAETARCLSGCAGVSVDEYCFYFPDTAGCPKPQLCCKAMTAECLSCADGVSVEEYCKNNPKTDGCPPKTCTLTGGEWQVVEHGWNGNDTGNNYCNTCFCSDGVLGCTKKGCPPLACCADEIATCLSCAAGVSVDEYCEFHPKTDGCKAEVDMRDNVVTEGNEKTHVGAKP